MSIRELVEWAMYYRDCAHVAPRRLRAGYLQTARSYIRVARCERNRAAAAAGRLG